MTRRTTLTALAAALALNAILASVVTAAPTGVLSDADLKALVTEHKDDDAKLETKLYTTAGRKAFNVKTDKGKQAQAAYEKSGKIPYRVTANLYQRTTGARSGKRLEGNAQVYMQDATGQTVFNETVSLKELCPT